MSIHNMLDILYGDHIKLTYFIIPALTLFDIISLYIAN